MNHNQQETQRGPGGKRHRQEEVPSRLEKEAREEDRGRENFTRPPAYDSSEQPDVTTEPERLSAKEEPKSAAQREKLRHPPAQKSDRG
ncbi:MAG TPA: hypothetical protein VF275_10250 [Gammaproteobacteria bacterium]